MDPLSCTVNVIAVIQLTGAIVEICGGYIKKVKNASADIILLRQEITRLAGVLEKLSQLLHSPHGAKLSTSQTLANDVQHCLSNLGTLRKKIEPAKKQTALSKIGFRALTWPLKQDEMKSVMNDLERYKSSFNLALQVDHISLTTEIVETTNRINQKIDLEGLPIAHGAEFDSYVDQHEDECLPGTRIELRQQIADWAVSSQGKCIFWLNGMAGTGKSTISRTMAKAFQKQGLLGASFFFKRGEGDRGNAIKLFPTITSQLLTRVPELLPAVTKAINDDPRIAAKPLKEQFDKLIIQPLLGLEQSNYQTLTMVIVIDALDECENDNDIRVILQILSRVQELSSIHLRVFLTSRPELPIRLGFKDAGSPHQDLTLHDIPKPIIEHDISLFLKHKLAEIRKERSLPPEWPGNANVQALVTMSVPLFIFAATICRVFGDHDLDPLQCLTEILEYQSEESKLDGTYLPVLNRLLAKQSGKRQRQLIEDVQEVVGIIILLENPLSIMSLSKLMGISTISINARLNSLHSVLSIPDDETMPIRLFHLSFRDFLLDPETREKTPFWVDEKKIHQKLTTYCLNVMRGNLKKNICNLQSYGTERKDIDTGNMNRYLLPELQYSCRYWTYHIAQSNDPMIHEVFVFLQENFLHWVEVMSMLGIISEVVGAIGTLESLVQGKNNLEISEFLHDAKRFTMKNSQIADIAPLQLYASGLIFTPQMSITKRNFERDLPSWLNRCPRVEETWSPELQTLEGHSDSVRSVAFSPDGRLLVSSSSDDTIKLWDPTTGDLKQTLESHSGGIHSVAFSLDSQLLASGSDIIKLWDTTTGDVKRVIKGHSGGNRSVVFSPDGQLLASTPFSYNDHTIMLWDPSTGDLKQTLKGYSGRIESVAFSPDGQLLASCSSNSNDHTIMLWDLSTGNLKQTLESHPGGIQAIAFSLDGQLLASGACDQTIKLWDPVTGVLKQTLKSHSASIQSVAFSLDGQLASSSNDHTVKLWDPTSGDLKQTLKGHVDWVYSVAFSPDSQLLASGSGDHTIKLWDPTARDLKQTLESHSDSVGSLAFSSDGQVLVSQSSDHRIKLWDPTTGVLKLKQSLKGHPARIQSVAFSPDGQLLACGSIDRTITVWDPSTGDLKQTLKGHVGTIQSVAFSSDRQLLVSGSGDYTIKLWDPNTGVLKQTLEGHLDWVHSVAFSPDGRLLASGSGDHTVKLWDPITGVIKQNLEGHLDTIMSVIFSPDGQLLVSCSGDHTIKLWDPITGDLKQTLSITGLVTDVTFSERSPYLVTNLGSFNLQPWYDGCSSDPSETKITVSLEAGQWVAIRGITELWLPPEYRPKHFAIYKSTIALGCLNGRVSLIEFCI